MYLYSLFYRLKTRGRQLNYGGWMVDLWIYFWVAVNYIQIRIYFSFCFQLFFDSLEAGSVTATRTKIHLNWPDGFFGRRWIWIFLFYFVIFFPRSLLTQSIGPHKVWDFLINMSMLLLSSRQAIKIEICWIIIIIMNCM